MPLDYHSPQKNPRHLPHGKEDENSNQHRFRTPVARESFQEGEVTMIAIYCNY